MTFGFLRGIILSTVLVLLLVGCAQKKYTFEYQQSLAEKNKTAQVVWPQPPDTARYRYLGDIIGEANLKEIEGSEGSLRKGISWLGKLVFGKAEPLKIYRPQGGAFDVKNRRIFVTDVGRKQVFVFDLINNRVDVWEGGGVDVSFIAPIAVVITDTDQVLITDAELGFVLRFDSRGKYLGRFGEKRLSRPTGISYNPESKKIFVADSKTHQIQVFSEDGKWLASFGGKGAKNGKFNSPTHLAFANNVLHVSDTLNARVQLFDESGKWLHSFGERGLNVGNMPRPKGIAVDSDANIYVVESYYDHLLMFNQKGEGLMAFGGTGSAPGQFDLPAGVWVDDTDKIYIADMFNQRIAVFQYLSVDAK